MAAPGFGFSFGDFVSAIKIVKDICRALQDIESAQTEYQHVLTGLQHLSILLEQLNHGTWDQGGDAGHLNAIKGMALTCKPHLLGFLDRIEKYNSLQGTSMKSFKARLGSEARKVQWAVCMKEEVEKFRAVIIAKMVSINLLIQLHKLSTVSKLGSEVRLLGKTSTPLHSQIQGCREDIQQLSGQIGKATFDRIDTKRSISTLVQICTGSKLGLEHFRNVNIAQHTEIQRRFNKLEEMHQRGHVIRVSNSESTKRLEKIVQQLLVVFGGFSVAMLKLLRLVLRTELETYSLLREMHCMILRTPVFGNEDSIQFVDALGRTEPLPYQYFRHWDIFEAMLRCKFKELPGEKLVEQGRYHLLDTKRKDLVIDRSKWERSVFPGTGISMSMIILGMLFNEGSCPRVTCGARNVNPTESTFVICSKCNLEYRCIDVSVPRETGLEEVVDHEADSRPAGGQDMSRGEGCHPQTGMKLDNIDFPMPTNLEISVEEELEAFKSIHIQIKSSESSDEKLLESHSYDTAPDIEVIEESISILIPILSLTELQITPDEPLGPRPTPESRIGKYIAHSLEIKGIVGKGRDQIFYSAYDHSNQTWYALKTLSKRDANGAWLDKRQREFQTRDIQLHYAASAHPNVVPVLKIVDEPECTYVILPFCPDGDLFTNITETDRFVGNDHLIRATFLQILSAVQHCHKLGIYHRDLRPENILVDGTQVLLSEFQLATTE